MGITDKGLAHVGRLSRLKYLRVGCSTPSSTLSDAGLEHVGRLHSLEELHIGGTRISDRGMSHIARLSQLKRLALIGTRMVTGAGLAELTRLKSLKRLSLGLTETTISELSQLNGLPLTHLQVDGVIQDDSGLDISGLVQLEELRLGGKARRVGRTVAQDPIRDKDLRCLSGLRNLKRLVISRPADLEGSISDVGLAHLKNLTRMEEIFIGGPHLTDDGLAHLAGMKELKFLRISGSLTDKGLRHLEGLKALRLLEVRSEKSFSRRAIERLRTKLPNIRSLRVVP